MAIKLIALCFLVLCAVIQLHAQCDTMPIPTRWDFPRYDSFNVRDPAGNFYNERLGLEGTHIDFTQAIQDGSPATFVKEGIENAGGNRENISMVAYANGKPKVYFEGLYLIDGRTLDFLADKTPLIGGYPFQSVGILNGPNYFQHLLLPDPVDTNIVHVFYGMAFAGNANWHIPFQKNMPAWYARYDFANDTILVQDSVLHGHATEAWAAMRHPDEESWWVGTRVHSPSGILVYQLSPNGLRPAIFSAGGLENWGYKSSDVGCFAFSPDGSKVAYSVIDSSGFPSPSYGEIYSAEFDCSTGEARNFIRLDSLCEPGGLAFSPSGNYLYANTAHNTSGVTSSDIDSLGRWKTPLQGGSWINEGLIPEGFARLGVTKGPDARIYTGPNNDAGVRTIQLGYIDSPDQWLAKDQGGNLIRPGGAEYKGLLPAVAASLSLTLPSIPVSLPELRTPRLRGENIVQCGDTLNYRLVENCYQELALVTATPGPGIEMTRTGSELTLSFDTATSFPQVRYLAMANDHTCRTYRDTFWIYVEGCENMCTPVFSNDQLTACDSALIHGQWQFTSDDYTQTFQNLQGCDSTSNVQLTLSQSVATTSAISACDSAFVHDNWVTTSGEYPASFTSAQGCDSTSTITVNVSSQLLSSEQISACDSAFVAGQWQFSSGDFSQTFQSIQGCDSIHTVQLSLKQSVSTSAIVAACDSAFVHDEWVVRSDSYSQTLSSVQGCDSTSTIDVVITPTPPSVLLPPDTTLVPQAGFSLNLDSLAAFDFTWQPPSAVDCDNCPTVEISSGFAGRLDVEIGEAPCTQSAFLTINRELQEATTFETPTAFSPNGDGINDFFEIALPDGFELLELSIFNRWGSQVYRGVCPCARNANGLIETWDGTFQNEAVNPGVFAWVAIVRNALGEERLEKGDVTVVK